MRRTWGDEDWEAQLKRHLDLEDADTEEANDDLFEEEGPLSLFEAAADRAYDEDIEASERSNADWFEDE